MTKAEQSMNALEYAKHVRERLDKWIDEKRSRSGWKK